MDSAVNTMGFPVLSLIVLVPLAGALLLLCLKDDLQIKRLTLLVTTLDLALTLMLLAHFNPATHLMQFSEQYQWIPALDIHYALGVDGISVLFVFLSAFLGWICVLASWRPLNST